MAHLYINNDWLFMPQYDEALMKEDFNKESLEKVRLPHTNKEISYHYFDEKLYQGVCGYYKTLIAEPEWKDMAVLLTFEGAAHKATVYINGQEVMVHQCGYTAFTVDIATYLKWGEANSLVVKLDTRESINVPPFGHVVDYLTYGGIYRDVYLDIKDKVYVEEVAISTKDILKEKKQLEVAVSLSKWQEELELVQTLVDSKGRAVELGKTALKAANETLSYEVSDIDLWDIEAPNLYVLETKLYKGSKLIDCHKVRFGFREAVFKREGFYLNGKKLKLRGLNRHQSYPYVGYAMPKMPQINDAEILKKELGVNAVRTSHYPQSHYFIDRCDELGLLVFTEMPGWQHIGDEAWQEVACENMREMVRQYRHHPSIILWGARINESVDNEDFYKKTNAIAHELDPTRQTGGVRCITHSQLLEDVYTYNDFIHEGDNRALNKKNAVTREKKAPYLVSEYNGHMYPTKAFDDELHRLEHALRHTRVLDALYKDEEIAGAFGWCMFDYNTHQDFGSGDRICYHGVLDMFRNPKLAASVYASQQEESPVLEVSNNMNIGEHPGGTLGSIYAFTNADALRIYKNGTLVKEYHCSDSEFKHLTHGPIHIDDLIGDQLEKGEGFSKKKSEAVKRLLMAGAEYGMGHLPFKEMLRAGKLMLSGMTVQEGLRLYNKYIANWGGEVATYRFEAIKDGKVVKTVTKSPMTKVFLEVKVDHDHLVEEHSYDVACIRLRAIDENGNLLNYYNGPISLSISGEISLIGPAMINLNGGMGGTYVKTTGKAGVGKLKISGNDFETVEHHFTIRV